jgi:hypothetical protein
LPNRRRLYLAGAVLALAVAVVVGIVLASGGGSGNPPAGGGATTSAQNSAKTQTTSEKKQTETPRTTQQPQTLNRSQLIAKGDAVCAKSQDKFKSDAKAIPTGEEEPNSAYSQLLVGISRSAVREFHALKPPPALRSAYDTYVKAQEEVAGWDRDALNAAKEGDATAYREARETRDNTAEERKQLAEAVGFQVCSGSEA